MPWIEDTPLVWTPGTHSPVPFRPGRIRSTRPYGGSPTPLPLVTTLPASSITDTSAFLNGAVNPQGQSGSWWFVYGTTPQYGASAAAVSFNGTSIPFTIGAEVTGLTKGVTYHCAAVAQTVGGLVYGNDVTFVAQTPVVPTPPTKVVQAESVQLEAPHLAYPFVLQREGALVLEQDTPDEVMACVLAIVACPVGACQDLPRFGIPDLTFTDGPPDPSPVVDSIGRLEPRAHEDAIVSVIGSEEGLGLYEIELNTEA